MIFDTDDEKEAGHGDFQLLLSVLQCRRGFEADPHKVDQESCCRKKLDSSFEHIFFVIGDERNSDKVKKTKE
jgi:hypothetical protein